jgi:redox-regulated HSP33 family molecular chaperone
MIDEDRLDELETYQLDDDTPDDAKVRIPAADLRDLVRCVAALRAAIAIRDAVLGAMIMRSDVLGAVKRFDEERGVL